MVLIIGTGFGETLRGTWEADDIYGLAGIAHILKQGKLCQEQIILTN
jgi:hypothetical protein